MISFIIFLIFGIRIFSSSLLMSFKSFFINSFGNERKSRFRYETRIKVFKSWLVNTRRGKSLEKITYTFFEKSQKSKNQKIWRKSVKNQKNHVRIFLSNFPLELIIVFMYFSKLPETAIFWDRNMLQS